MDSVELEMQAFVIILTWDFFIKISNNRITYSIGQWKRNKEANKCIFSIIPNFSFVNYIVSEISDSNTQINKFILHFSLTYH